MPFLFFFLLSYGDGHVLLLSLKKYFFGQNYFMIVLQVSNNFDIMTMNHSSHLRFLFLQQTVEGAIDLVSVILFFPVLLLLPWRGYIFCSYVPSLVLILFYLYG